MKKTHAPVVERVAGWSARHKKTAVFGWLLLVIAAVVVGQRLGTSDVNSYDPGQAGQAERVLNRPVVQQPDSESVLVQGRPGQSYGHDPQLQQAVREVVAALRAVPGSATAIASGRRWLPSTSRGRRVMTTRRSSRR
jgi:RND superfamily putative drug exporter